MRSMPCSLLAAVLLGGAALTLDAAAATLTSAYEFSGNLADAVLEGHDDALVSGTRGFGAGTVTANSFVFGNNQGVSLTHALVDPASYSIELYFKFTSNFNNSYRTVLDPGSARSDQNLYVLGDERLDFYPAPASASGVVSEGLFDHLVFTRAASGVQVYVNGALVLNDGSGSTIAESYADGNVLHFFEDDAFEVASGEIDYIRLYNGVMSAGDVAAHYALRDAPLAPVPLPGSLPLLVSAAGLLALRRARG